MFHLLCAPISLCKVDIEDLESDSRVGAQPMNSFPGGGSADSGN